LLALLDCCSTEVYVQRFELWLSFRKNDVLEVQFVAKYFRALWGKAFVVPKVAYVCALRRDVAMLIVSNKIFLCLDSFSLSSLGNG